MPTISKGLRQAYELQDITHAAILALKASMVQEDGTLFVRRDEYGKPVDAAAIAQLVKAWRECQERISFHRRVPAPGSLTHKAPAVRRARNASGSSGPITLPSGSSASGSSDIVDVSAEVAPDTAPEQPGNASPAIVY